MSGPNWLRGRTIIYNPVPEREKPKRFKIFKILFEAFKRTCMVLGALVLISSLIVFWSLSRMTAPNTSPVLPAEMFLVLKLEGRIAEQNSQAEYFAELGLIEPQMTVQNIVDAIDRARTDPRVKGLAFSIKPGSYNLAQIQEIRSSVLRFRETGKMTVAYAASYGETASGLGVYYLASAFDQIWMQPVGSVLIAGINMQAPYLKDFMNRFGVEVQFFQRKEYKTAMEFLTASQMSTENREMMSELVQDLGNQIVADVTRDRPEVINFRGLINQGLFTDEEALSKGLIDRLDYSDHLMSYIRKTITGDEKSESLSFVKMDRYWLARTDQAAAPKSRPQVAIVHVSGLIADGLDVNPYSMNDDVADASQIADAIRDAAEDSDIGAILLQINSPGGMPSAAETIRRAVVLAKTEHQKPVYVVMKSSAASGGYWVAVNADQIFALPSTITGSIGVIGGKINVRKLLSDQKIKMDGVKYGDHAGFLSPTRAFSPSEQAVFELSLDNVYAHFIRIVAEGRGLTEAQVDTLARGRVWTGRQAVKLGLVDQLGGVDVALDALAQKLGVASRSDLQLVYLPKPDSPFVKIIDFLEQGSPLSQILSQVFDGILIENLLGPRVLAYENLPSF